MKTYAVYGIMEWLCQIVVNKKSKISILFCGGSMTGYGVTPALYRTDSPVVQAVIENSYYYKTGKIVLHHTTERQEAETRRQSAPATAPAAETAGKKAAASEIPDGTDRTAAEESIITNEPDSKDSDSIKGLIGPVGEKGDQGSVVMKVSDISEARDYLAESYGIARSSMRSIKSVLETAERLNVIFEGL